MVRYLLYILFLYALTAFPSHLAGADPTPVPHAIVILCPGLRVDDLTDPALLHLRALAQRGAVGLMNTAVTEPKTDTAAVQVVARGIGEPARPTAAESYFGEGADMRGVFAGALFEGLASALSPSGSFKSLDAKAGLRTFPSAVDLSHWAAQQPGIVVVRVTAGPDLDALLAVMPLGSVRVLLVSPRPPSIGSAATGRWENRLTPTVLAGASIAPGLLTSATTRTSGLIANVDVAPTIWAWAGLPVPATMTGHVLAVVPALDPIGTIARMDRRLTVIAQATLPIFILLGLCGGVAAFGGIWLVRRRAPGARRLPIVALFFMNMPLAMLLAAKGLLCGFRSPIGLTIEIVVWMLLGAVIQAGAGMLLGKRRSAREAVYLPLRWVALWTALVILIDAICGEPLGKFAVFSTGLLQGIRFYGMGNECLGMLIGMTLLWVFLSGLSAREGGIVFLVAAFMIGFPRLGANAGGLIVAAAAFGVGWTLLRGRAATWRIAILWTLLGTVLTFGFGVLERFLPINERLAPSHIGGSLQSAQVRGYGYLLEIAGRKMLMNTRILVHPGMLSALAGFSVLLLTLRAVLRREIAILMARHADWTRGFPAVGFGALAALLFKDSGVVVASFLSGIFLAAGFYFLFADSTVERLETQV